MELEKLFYLIFICLLSKSTLSVYVSDLKPDVDCKTLLAEKSAERMKDPTLVSIYQFIHSYRSSMEKVTTKVQNLISIAI